MYKLAVLSPIIIFILGLYFTYNYTSKQVLEGFAVSKTSCPNILSDSITKSSYRFCSDLTAWEKYTFLGINYPM